MEILIPSMSNMCSDVTKHLYRNHLTIFHTNFLKGRYSVVVEMTPILCDSYILYKK